MPNNIEWFAYVIHNRKGPSIYFAGNRPNEVRDYLVRDLQHCLNSIEGLTSGTVTAPTADEAIEELMNGGWKGDTLPLRGEERQEASNSFYRRLEVKGAS